MKKVTYTGRIVYRFEKHNPKAGDFPLVNQVIEVNGTKVKTDSCGNFRVYTNEFNSIIKKRICVRIPAINDYVCVRAKVKSSPYVKEHCYPPKEVVNYKIPQIYLLEEDNDSIGVMISQRLIYAYELLKKIGWNNKKMVVVVYPLVKLGSYDYHNSIYINKDDYSDDILFHEFGHSVAFEYGFMALSYHSHDRFKNRMIDIPTHKLPISKKSCTKLTFNEGFADFFSRMVKKTFCKELNCYPYSYYNYVCPLPDFLHKYFGEIMEECVCSVLYEMIDSNFEYFYPSVLQNNPSSIDFKKLMNWIREYGSQNLRNEHFSGFVGFIRKKYELDYTRMFHLFEKYGFAIRNISFTSKTRTFHFENGGDAREKAKASSVLNDLLCNIYNPSDGQWYEIKDFNLKDCTCQIPLNIYNKLGEKFKCYFSCSQIDPSGFKTGPYFTEDHWFSK